VTSPAVMIGLGEVLWDLLPSGKVLGGAPANFAYMTSLLGDQGIVASRVGDDESGREACRVIQELGLSTAYVQFDHQHPTGTAGVFIDSAGQPTFTIKESVSWDFLEWTESWEQLSAQADVVCFGSLAQRSPTSAATIERFLQNTPRKTLRIFDANLRESFYSAEVLRRSLRYADIVKLNEQELLHAASLLGFDKRDEETPAQRLLTEFSLRLVCVTRGAHGSLLVSAERTVEHKGFRVTVADAVGAGDAFAACLAHHYVRGKSLEEISESANRFASWVATQVGAMPTIHRSRLPSIFRETKPD
jgi:fructokinase